MSLTYAELCAGYGGLGLAIEEVMGAHLSWYSEFDPAPSKIVAAHWPDAPNHGDMTQIDWATVEPVDIISGGTPCQDLSHAGRRAGMTEGTRSNLWVQMREAIATIKPTYVVWENVRGAYSAGADSDLEPCPGCVGDPSNGGPVLRALGRVLGDLSDLGYDSQWRGLRAADVGAPHPRFRIFLLGTLRDADSSDVEGVGASGEQIARLASGARQRGGASAPTQDANCPTCGQRWQPAPGQTESGRSRADTGRRSGTPTADHEGFDRRDDRGTADNRDRHEPTGGRSGGIDWAEYKPAISRWESTLGRRAPAPVEPAPQGGIRLSAHFCEWMMGLPAGWVTDVDISRNEHLKALGNGVVPAQAAAALKDMLRSQE